MCEENLKACNLKEKCDTYYLKCINIMLRKKKKKKVVYSKSFTSNLKFKTAKQE